MPIDWGQSAAEAIETLQALLRIDTSNPPGQELAAAEYLADRARALGLSPTIITPAPGRGNVIVRLNGNGQEPPILLSAHLDVVPATDEGWREPPFGGALVDGWVWGRGALDMKYAAAQALAVMGHIKQSGIELRRDIIFAGVADGKQGGRWGAGHLVDHFRHLIQAEFCLTKLGGLMVKAGSGRVVLVGTATKGFEWLRVRVRGQPGNPGKPNPRSAINRLVHGLHRLENGRLAYSLPAATRAMLTGLAALHEGKQGLALSLLKNRFTAPWALRGISGEAGYLLEASVYHTAVVTGLEAGDPRTPNVGADTASAVIDARYLPSYTREKFLAKVASIMGPDAEIESLRGLPPTDFARRNELMVAIERAVQARDPGAHVLPFVVPGFTDASHYARAGMTTYGFFPLELAAGEPFLELLHAPNERVSVAGFTAGLGLLGDTLVSLCAAEPARATALLMQALPERAAAPLLLPAKSE